MFPASNQFISRWIPPQEQGIANGLVFAGVGVGAGVTPSLIAYVMFHYGWRWSFWLSAILGLLAGAGLYCFSPGVPAIQHHIFTSRTRHLSRGPTPTHVQP